MYGIDGIDHIAEDGLLRRVIAGSYPSGPSSMPSPRIWRMIHEDRVEAYNIPSGILFQWHGEIATGRPGVLAQVGMGTYLDPRQTGGRMNDATTQDLIELVDFDGREWLYLRSIPWMWRSCGERQRIAAAMSRWSTKAPISARSNRQSPCGAAAASSSRR